MAKTRANKALCKALSLEQAQPQNHAEAESVGRVGAGASATALLLDVESLQMPQAHSGCSRTGTRSLAPSSRPANVQRRSPRGIHHAARSDLRGH